MVKDRTQSNTFSTEVSEKKYLKYGEKMETSKFWIVVNESFLNCFRLFLK